MSTLDWQIPDYMEALEGWRIWRVRSDGALLSVEHAVPWAEGSPHIAHCPFGPYAAHRHQSPALHCSCGIYALRYRDDLPSLLATPGAIAVGRVRLWGRVVEHERGWRAQYAYPSALTILCPDRPVVLASHVATRYGVFVRAAVRHEDPVVA